MPPQEGDPFPDTKVPSLLQLAFKAASPASWARQGLVVSSTQNLHEDGGKKLVNIMTTYCKPVHGMQYKIARLTHLFPKTIEIVTHLCKATEEVGKHHPELDLYEITSSMNMSTAAGINGMKKASADINGIPSHENPNGNLS